jgi:hypothetical protein
VPDEKRDIGVAIVVGMLFAECAPLAEVVPVVGSDYYYGVLPKREFIDLTEKFAEPPVYHR